MDQLHYFYIRVGQLKYQISDLVDKAPIRRGMNSRNFKKMPSTVGFGFKQGVCHYQKYQNVKIQTMVLLVLLTESDGTFGTFDTFGTVERHRRTEVASNGDQNLHTFFCLSHPSTPTLSPLPAARVRWLAPLIT